MSDDHGHGELVLAAGLAHAIRLSELASRLVVRPKKPAGPVYRDARHRRQVEAKKARQAAAAKRRKRS